MINKKTKFCKAASKARLLCDDFCAGRLRENGEGRSDGGPEKERGIPDFECILKQAAEYISILTNT